MVSYRVHGAFPVARDRQNEHPDDLVTKPRQKFVSHRCGSSLEHPFLVSSKQPGSHADGDRQIERLNAHHASPARRCAP